MPILLGIPWQNLSGIPCWSKEIQFNLYLTVDLSVLLLLCFCQGFVSAFHVSFHNEKSTRFFLVLFPLPTTKGCSTALLKELLLLCLHRRHRKLSWDYILFQPIHFRASPLGSLASGFYDTDTGLRERRGIFLLTLIQL